MQLSVEEIVKVTGAWLISGGKGEVFQKVSTDSRKVEGGELFIALKGPRYDGNNFAQQALEKGARGVLVSRPLYSSKGTILWVDDTLKALQKLAVYWREKVNPKVIAVTGSCGKTTTKEMIYHVLKSHFPTCKSPGNFNNIIGLPLSLLNMGADTQFMVVELGVSERGEMERLAALASPWASIITAIGPGHLEGFKEEMRVAEEKRKLLSFTSSVAFLNADDPFFSYFAQNFSGELISFGIEEGDIRPKRLDFDSFYRAKVEIGKGSFHLSIPGIPSVYSALVAFEVGRYLGIEEGEILESISTFSPLPGRMRLMEVEGVYYLDDTYNANPLSFRRFLEVMENIKVEGRRIVVIGDMLELGERAEEEHSKLAQILLSSSIDVVITTGNYTRLIFQALKGRREVFHLEREKISSFLSLLVRERDLVGVKASHRLELEKVLPDALSVSVPS